MDGTEPNDIQPKIILSPMNERKEFRYRMNRLIGSLVPGWLDGCFCIILKGKG